MNNIVVNADDFGLEHSVNNAIIESFNNGLINSTTIMANMPGFDEAVDLAYKHGIYNKIGIHLNLEADHLLTSNILTQSILESRKIFKFKDNRMNLFFISENEKKLIFKEFASQIEKVINVGIQITHIDSHHHIHEIWPLIPIIITLLKEYKIPTMRILNNLNQSSHFYKSIYRKFTNRIIMHNNVNFSDFFGNQIEVMNFHRSNPSLFYQKQIEIMVHPEYNIKGQLIDKIKKIECNFDYLKELEIISA